MKQKYIRFYKQVLKMLLVLAAYLTVKHFYDKHWSIYDSSIVYKLKLETESVLPDCEPVDSSLDDTGVDLDGFRYPFRVSLSYNRSINFDCLRRTNVTKRILVWKRFFGTLNLDETERNLLEKANCPVHNCEITHDRKKLNTSDLVYVIASEDFGKLPLEKPRQQQWVFGVYESPMHTKNLNKYSHYFNLSSTYSLSSDFPNFYRNSFDRKFVWKKNQNFDVSRDFSENKSGLAFAIISNCDDNSMRLEFIEKIGQDVPVDIYGKCGRPCPSSNYRVCKQILAQKYKFYLAFENSICDEYLTEKFFEILHYDTLPIVLGGGHYEKFHANSLLSSKIPKSGYINALDFYSAHELARYVKFLDKNKQAYNSYFKWKQYLSPNTQKPINMFEPFCDMCIYLNLQRFEKSAARTANVLSNIEEFFSRKKKCKLPSLKAVKSYRYELSNYFSFFFF